MHVAGPPRLPGLPRPNHVALGGETHPRPGERFGACHGFSEGPKESVEEDMGCVEDAVGGVGKHRKWEEVLF